MNKFRHVILVMALLLPSESLFSNLPEDPAEYEAWEARMLTQIEELRQGPSSEAIPKLGKWVMQLAMDTNQEKGTRPVFKASQQLLLSIPGHADYFGNKIRNDDILRETGRGHEVDGGVAWDFEILGQLPSPETVKVLGSFLDDERHRIEPTPGADVAPVPANDLLAARAFHSLKIVNPPLQKRPGGYDDLQPWRLWFAQVQAGNRTFRFEGNPQEYSLAGPVSEAREPKSVDRAPGSNEVPASAVEAEQKTTNLPIWSLTLAGVILAVAIWSTTKRKPAAS